jgi:sulfite reductase beta subunit-like hemoprotein
MRLRMARTASSTTSWRRTCGATASRGFSTVEVKVARGDLTPEQLRGLARIMREYTGGYARTSVHQNLIWRWVRTESVYEVYRRLRELGLGEAGADEITDVVSCPGTDSCKLAITSSMGLNQAVQDRLIQMHIGDGLTRRIHVKISGCPNGCGQHHIANIGFYGASIKVGKHTIPAYIPHLGGRYEHGEVRYGERLRARIPAKRVPEPVDRWVRHYERERDPDEHFNEFVDRTGTRRFEALVKDLTLPAEFTLENMNLFIDWTKTAPFEVVRGEGECAV